jgi:hypothetical protein
MKKKILFATIAICLSLGAVAHANDPQISVTNDKSAIDVAPPYQSKEPPLNWWDFGVSSWSPSNLRIPTSNVGSVSLQDSAVDLYLNDTYQIFGSKIWSGKLGLNWRPLQLSVNDSSNGEGVPITQSSQLISIRLGVEVNPTWAQGSWVQGYAGFSLLPSFLFTGRGGADLGSTDFGMLAGLAVGARFPIYKSFSLDVGAMQTVGWMNSSSASGFGFNGGLRIEQ